MRMAFVIAPPLICHVDFVSHRYEAGGDGQDGTSGLKKAGGVSYVPSLSTRLAD